MLNVVWSSHVGIVMWLAIYVCVCVCGGGGGGGGGDSGILFPRYVRKLK